MTTPDRAFIPIALASAVAAHFPRMIGAKHHASQKIKPFAITWRFLLVPDQLLLDRFPFIPAHDGLDYREVRQRYP